MNNDLIDSLEAFTHARNKAAEQEKLILLYIQTHSEILKSYPDLYDGMNEMYKNHAKLKDIIDTRIEELKETHINKQK